MLRGTRVLSVIFPEAFSSDVSNVYQQGITVHAQGEPLCVVGVKSDSPFMVIHIPPACITGMQKLTFFFFPRIKPDTLFFKRQN